MCENQRTEKEISLRTNYYHRLKERTLQKEWERNMVIWVDKDIVFAACDQRAVIQLVHGFDIDIRLLGDNSEFTIRPQDIVGVEIAEHLTIRFKQTGHQITEIYCYKEKE